MTQMNRSGRKGRNSCVDAEVCANLMISKRKTPKKLLTPPTSLEMCVNRDLTYKLPLFVDLPERKP